MTYESTVQPVRVFAPCAYSWSNKGDATLVLALVQSLEREFGSVEVTCTSWTPKLDKQYYKFPVLRMPLRPNSFTSRVIHHPLRWMRLSQLSPYLVVLQLATFLFLMRLWMQLYRHAPSHAFVVLPPSLRKVVQTIMRSDVAVAVPGGYLMAQYFTKDYWMYHAATLGLTKILGRPLVLYPCSIGPFPGIHRVVARWVLSRCDLIILREMYSLEHLRKLGIGTDNVRILPDAAFSFEDDGQGEREIRSVITRLNILPRPWIGVSVREHHFSNSADPRADFEKYMDAVAQTADFSIERFGVGAVFVPQTGEDLWVAKEVFRRMKHPEHALVLGDDLSPQALKALYAELEVMIGTRMHANILSIISGTPVVAVAYEHKTAGIMNMLGLASFVVPIDQASERLQAVTQRLWMQRNQVRTLLPERVARMRSGSKQSAQYVRWAIGKNHQPDTKPPRVGKVKSC